MSESDGTLSSAESLSSQKTSNSTESSDEMEVVGGEPLAHSSDEEEDTEEDQDGLSLREFSNSPRDFRSFQRILILRKGRVYLK